MSSRIIESNVIIKHTVQNELTEIRPQLRVGVLPHKFRIPKERHRSRIAHGPSHKGQTARLAISTDFGNLVRLREPDKEMSNFGSQALHEGRLALIQVFKVVVGIFGGPGIITAVHDDKPDVVLRCKGQKFVEGI